VTARKRVSTVFGVLGGFAMGTFLMVAANASCGAVEAACADGECPAGPTGPQGPAGPPGPPGTAVSPPGTIVAFAGPNPPEGWLLCDGGAVSRSENAALFAAIGTLYGAGDDITTFNVPDLRGRAVFGAGTGPSLSARPLAARGGEEQHTLTVAEMPAHSHRERGTNRLDVATGGGSHVQDVDNPDFGPIETHPTGGGQPHNPMPPFVVLNYIIKT
jgi:microcystin-dependent protein